MKRIRQCQSRRDLHEVETHQELGKWLVPQTKHYSWMKALDICGVGLDQMIAIPVDDCYRMDVQVLEKTIRETSYPTYPHP